MRMNHVRPATALKAAVALVCACGSMVSAEQSRSPGPSAGPAHAGNDKLIATYRDESPAFRSHQAIVPGFNAAHRHALPTGTWGCPGPIKVHPLAKVPNLVFWQQSNYNQPQQTDGLKWAIYVGRPGAAWVTYDIPVFDPSGQPVAKLERPRISFAFDPDGYPAIAIGLDDGGIRYYENQPLGDAVHIGSIALVRPVREAAGQWTTEFVPFELADPNYQGSLDYPHLSFTPSGDPVVSAIAYHAVFDDYDAEKPYEDMLLARKSADQWRVQRVLDSICPCFCFDCPGSNSPGRDVGSTAQSSGPCLVLGNLAGGSVGEVLVECPFSLNPYARYVGAYPSLSIRTHDPATPDDDIVRLAFTFGELVSPVVSQFRNFVYAVDFGISPDAVAGDGPLPVITKKKTQHKTTTDYFDDFVYTGQSGNGVFLASFGSATGPLYNDEYQLRKNTGSMWNLLPKSRIPTLQEYDRHDFRYWLPETVQQLGGSSLFGFLTPFAASSVIQEWDTKALATSISYFGSSLSGCSGPYYCSQPVVDNTGSELAYDPSLIHGAFPAPVGLQGKAIVAFHVEDEIIISPQDQPLAPSAGYGDFDFDLVANSCNDACIFEAADSDEAWTSNPICDGDGDGDVDDVDQILFGSAPACCP